MKELKTLYPYGLNDKCGNAYYSEYRKERLVYSIFNKLIVKRNQRGNKKGLQNGIKTDKTIQNFIQKMKSLIISDGNWRQFCYSFIIGSSLQLLKKLKAETVLLAKMIGTDKCVLHFISDLINHRFMFLRHKSKQKNLLKIHFDNKGIEKVNIQSLLHKVTDTIPSFFSNKSPPTIIYTRTSSIGSRIFNYKNVVLDLKPKEWCAKDHPCECSKSPFDPNHGHVMTGNLNIIANHKLRVLLSKGPSYREANDIDWGKVFVCIKKGISAYVKTWCNKESVDVRVLSEWKNRLLLEVRSKITSLRRQRYYPKRNKVLDNEEVKSYLDRFHQQYVITPTDKAGNNFSIVCKQFYIHCLLKELNIADPSKKSNSQATYRHIKNRTKQTVVNKHISYMKAHKIALDSSQESLPFLYWIPKMHKNPTKQRYIAASHCCSTKPLSKMITYCLKLVQQTHKNYCTRIAKTRHYNKMWIVDNSVEVLDKLSICNQKSVRNVRTFDFSTLYTSIPHEKLKKRMAVVINQCFNTDGRRFIRIGRTSASWSKTRGDYSWNKDQLIDHINYLIDNIYVTCGDNLFRQVIGIPMGTDCAPFLANLFLYSYESEWMDKKLKNKDFDILHKFNRCYRYIDDLLCINNDQIMDEVMSDIYPKELSLTSDDAILSTNYLDLRIDIKDNNIHTSLFDKRDAFGFKIINFPYLTGNIPTKQSYGVFVSQLVRYARCCQDFEDFRSRTSILIDRLVRQHFTISLLKRTFEKFAESYYGLLAKYGVHASTTCVFK